MANLAGNYPEDTLANRFTTMDMDRRAKLVRARECAQLSIPQLLPPENWTEQYALPQPFSSATAKGVTGMASRILSALMPLNDMPFFQFSLKDGTEPDPEALPGPDKSNNILSILVRQGFIPGRSIPPGGHPGPLSPQADCGQKIAVACRTEKFLIVQRRRCNAFSQVTVALTAVLCKQC